MKKFWFILLSTALIGLVGAFIWSVQDTRETSRGASQIEWVKLGKVAIDQPVPDFRFIDGNQKSRQFLLGKKTKILNFWASWCGPCIQEIPSMAKMAHERRGQFEILAIANDSDEKEFHKALRLFPDFSRSEIEILFDPDKRVMKAYGVTGFPETFIISPEGLLIKKIVGPVEWDKLPPDFFKK